MSTPDYDYIIAGAGCAGLSLVVHLLRSDILRDKKILILDRSTKSENDRTWCFWEKEPDLFQSIVYREWMELLFKNYSSVKNLQIKPYTYKMIRGIDFYQYCLKLIDDVPNITFLQSDIEQVFGTGEVGVIAGGKKYTAQFVFNSTFSIPYLKEKEYWLLQHFKGWIIKTEKPAFNYRVATLMDFSTNQKHGTSFFYVLPFTETEALVEYTLFSKAVLQDDEYDASLEYYITNNLQISDYKVISSEIGTIPMTNYKFHQGDGNMINIGTAGGQTKGSSGYTFRFIQKHSASIVTALEESKHPLQGRQFPSRHHFYDSVLLNILHHNAVPGDHIFTDLFTKNAAHKVLEFLDNESKLGDELQIISSLPIRPFATAAVRQLL